MAAMRACLLATLLVSFYSCGCTVASKHQKAETTTGGNTGPPSSEQKLSDVPPKTTEEKPTSEEGVKSEEESTEEAEKYIVAYVPDYPSRYTCTCVGSFQSILTEFTKLALFHSINKPWKLSNGTHFIMVRQSRCQSMLVAVVYYVSIPPLTPLHHSSMRPGALTVKSSCHISRMHCSMW